MSTIPVASPLVTAIINGVLDREGGKYTNDPNDAGGPTKWGITLKTYQAYVKNAFVVTEKDIENLSRSQAWLVYYDMYVKAPGFDRVTQLSAVVGEELIDSGVNCGVQTAGQWLQRCLNAMNRQQKDYSDVAVDGDIGPATRTALTVFLQKRGQDGELVLWRYLNALQGAYYILLGEKHKNDEEYVFGWGLNRLGGKL